MGNKKDLVQSFDKLTSNQRDQVGDEGIPGCVGERHVKFKIERSKRLFILESCLHLREQLAELLDLFRGSVQSGISGRYTFQRYAHFQQILDIVSFGNHSPFDDLPQKLLAINRDRGSFSDPRIQHTNDRQTTESLPQR